ncbi:MAG: hypothetical protein J5689_00115 [Clostridia bacterium]|nr:hypothetical protein [Clostridia bacterium]
MKKKNWLLTIAFAVLSLTIISTCVIGSTYAKFTSGIASGAKVQAAGFLVDGGEVDLSGTFAMVAPGETKATEVTVNYFSQVETVIAASTATITGTGVFDTTDPDGEGQQVSPWVAFLTAYKATSTGTANTNITTSTPLSTVFTISIGSGTGTLAEDFAAAVAAEATSEGSAATLVTGQTTRLNAMGAAETEALEVEVEVNVTWNEVDDVFDTMLGNAIAELLQAQTSVVSYINVSLPLTASQYTGS